jgi:hypothetical protein
LNDSAAQTRLKWPSSMEIKRSMGMCRLRRSTYCSISWSRMNSCSWIYDSMSPYFSSNSWVTSFLKYTKIPCYVIFSKQYSQPILSANYSGCSLKCYLGSTKKHPVFGIEVISTRELLRRFWLCCNKGWISLTTHSSISPSIRESIYFKFSNS